MRKCRRNQINEPGRTTRGFTLIELLVVVSIIALLVSILLPALGKAREGAKRAVCLSNQHQIVLGIIVYATENDDRFPSHGYDGANAGSTFYLYYANQDANKSEWLGLGRLYDKKVIEDERVFFCPSQTPDSLFSYETGWSVGSDKPSPWDVDLGSLQWGSYIYRIFDQNSGSANDTGIITPEYVKYISNLKFTQAKAGMAITSDIFQKNYADWKAPGMITWAHSQPPQGVNAAYADGSAKWVFTGEERYHNSVNWLNSTTFKYDYAPDDYAVLFFKCLDTGDFTPLDDAYIDFIMPLL